MALDPQSFQLDLIAQLAGRRVCIAYSGGVDSHVLFHLLASISGTFKTDIRAVYVDHGLHADASLWGKHCQRVAQELGVPFKSIPVNVKEIDVHGLESAARKARYAAFREDLATDEVLLTAQHQQDQAETLILQLLRGAGPNGLSAMWPETYVDGLTIIRPLLSTSKADILDYANKHRLDWIEDPSNADDSINRNYLRQHVWPSLSQRWPALEKTVSRSAMHCREASELMHALAELDAKDVVSAHGQVSISALNTLSLSRQRNLLRYMIQSRGIVLPSTVIVNRIIYEVCRAGADRNPQVSWSDVIVRRYRNHLYFDRLDESRIEQNVISIRDHHAVSYSDTKSLIWERTVGNGLQSDIFERELTLQFRQGGESIRLSGHAHHKSLKHLFQEWLIPPWQREQIPLVFADKELIAVVGYGYAEGYATRDGEEGWLPVLKASF